MSRVHPQARLTPRTRAEIRSCEAPLTVLAERYNVTKATVRKWRGREDMQDRSHRPNTLSTTLTPAQEAIVVELRRTLLLPLDDLLALTHEFINRAASRSGLDRCLRRHGVSNLAELIPVVEGEAAPKKTFKDYEPGFLHVDIKYLPQMPDETTRRYLFVAIDRATRWVYFRTYADQTETSSTDFLRRLHRTAPMVIQKVLTDNGSQFTDRFQTKAKSPSGKHLFDLACAKLGIEHRLAPPRHPQTNGMVERFNGRISDLVAQTRFASAAELDTTLKHYLATYNNSIPQRALNHQSPVQTLKVWQAKKPQLFVKRVYEHAGLDSYVMLRADVLMGIFSGLDADSRTTALEAFRKSVAESGGKSVARYCAAAGGDAAGLLAVLEATSAQLGWGAWAFETTPDALTLQVTNSPFAMALPASAHPVCHAILGILENAAPLVLNGAVQLQETRCAARDGGQQCTFHAARS